MSDAEIGYQAPEPNQLIGMITDLKNQLTIISSAANKTVSELTNKIELLENTIKIKSFDTSIIVNSQTNQMNALSEILKGLPSPILSNSNVICAILVMLGFGTIINIIDLINFLTHINVYWSGW